MVCVLQEASNNKPDKQIVIDAALERVKAKKNFAQLENQPIQEE